MEVNRNFENHFNEKGYVYITIEILTVAKTDLNFLG